MILPTSFSFSNNSRRKNRSVVSTRGWSKVGWQRYFLEICRVHKQMDERIGMDHDSRVRYTRTRFWAFGILKPLSFIRFLSFSVLFALPCQLCSTLLCSLSTLAQTEQSKCAFCVTLSIKFVLTVNPGVGVVIPRFCREWVLWIVWSAWNIIIIPISYNVYYTRIWDENAFQSGDFSKIERFVYFK